jgi:hypothetical protein
MRFANSNVMFVDYFNNWKTMTTINAFHPDYIKTYHPEFLTTIRVESSQHSHGVINGGKSKAKRESVKGKNVNTINIFPKTQSTARAREKERSKAMLDERKRKILEAKDFHIFNKAVPSTTPKEPQ